MTPERDRLLAEKARIEAELAKLDAPDPLLIEAREICADHWERRGIFHFAAKIREGVCDDNSDVDSALAALRRGMELAAAPLMPRDAGMSEEEIAELARDAVATVSKQRGHEPPIAEGLSHQAAAAAIRETLKRAPQVRWPGEAVPVSRKVYEYLLGEGELDGKWHGDGPPEGQHPFWWRRELRRLRERVQ